MTEKEVLAWAQELPIKELRHLRKGWDRYLATLTADEIRDLEKQVHERKRELQQER